MIQAEGARLLFSLMTLAGVLSAIQIGVWLHTRKLGNRLRGGGMGAGTDGITLMYFWAEGCAQCAPQERQIELAQRQLSELDRRMEVRKMHAADQKGGVVALGVLTVPTTAVIDPSGNILAINPGLTSAAKLVKQCLQLSPGK
jgi:hypothetical protein